LTIGDRVKYVRREKLKNRGGGAPHLWGEMLSHAEGARFRKYHSSWGGQREKKRETKKRAPPVTHRKGDLESQHARNGVKDPSGKKNHNPKWTARGREGVWEDI